MQQSPLSRRRLPSSGFGADAGAEPWYRTIAKLMQGRNRTFPHTLANLDPRSAARLGGAPRSTRLVATWLILPVVICLFQGLSHACLRITAMQESAHGSLHQTQSAAKMLRKRIIGYLVRNAKLIHELMGSFRSTRRRLAESVVTDPADE